MLKHNKKRNVGLLNEFFSKYMAKCIVEQNYQGLEEAKQIWRKYFHPKSELIKEKTVFDALYESEVKNKEVAGNLMANVRKMCHEQNSSKLEEEKTKLINEIQKTLRDENFFNREIEDYRNLATVQILINSWRNDKSVSITEMIELEDKMMTHLLTEKSTPSKDPSVLQTTENDIDSLVLNIMIEKFNEKFKKELTTEQFEMIKHYSFIDLNEESREKLKNLLEEVRRSTLTYIEYELNNSNDKLLEEKLSPVKTLLETTYRNVNDLNDDLIAFYMHIANLRKELLDETSQRNI